MSEDTKELIFYYKARQDPYTKPAVEAEELPASGNVDLEIILLGPKREQLKLRDKRHKRSTKLRRLYSSAKSDMATEPQDDDDDNYDDIDVEEEGVDKKKAPKDDRRTPVAESDDDDYQSAEESKLKDEPAKSSSKTESPPKPSRIPRIRARNSQVASERKPSKGSEGRKGKLLDRLESLFNTTDNPVSGNSGSNVDYMDYF